MDEIFREWLINLIGEEALNLEEMSKIINDEEATRDLIKDYFAMNYYEIIPWIQEETAILKKMLEEDN